MKIRPVGTEVRTVGQSGGQRDRHDEARSRFSQLCEKRLEIEAFA